MAQQAEECRDEGCCTHQQEPQQEQQQHEKDAELQPQEDAGQQRQKPAASSSGYRGGEVKAEKDEEIAKVVMDASRDISCGFQVSVKMVDSKTVTMDVEPNDKIGDIVKKEHGSWPAVRIRDLRRKGAEEQ